MVYRKSRQGDMWHCCRNCRFWPERRGAYVERNSKPASGELCERGLASMRRGDCTPVATIHVRAG
jgi:hypothetical protein